MTKQELKIHLDRWFNRNWEHFRSEVGKNIANGRMFQYRDDLCIQMYEEFMNKPHDQQLQMYQDDKILNWLLVAASFQIRSGTSPFYRRYRKNRIGNVPDYYAENEAMEKGEVYEIDDVHLDDYYQCAMNTIKEENIGYYYARLIDLKFIQQLSYTAITEKYGLPLSGLKRDMSKALEIIRNKCKYLEE